MPRLITVEEAAELLAVSASTIRNWIKRDTIPYIELPKKSAGNTRGQYRIPLQGLLNTLSGNYDLGAALTRLDQAGTELTDEAYAEMRRGTRRESGTTRPTEVDGADPGDIFEHANARSE
jgi:excisionase family DNA binding protein